MVLAIKDFPNELHRKARIRAAEEDITLKDLVIAAIAFYLESERTPKRTPDAP